LALVVESQRVSSELDEHRARQSLGFFLKANKRDPIMACAQMVCKPTLVIYKDIIQHSCFIDYIARVLSLEGIYIATRIASP
jgi:hypothetical protein